MTQGDSAIVIGAGIVGCLTAAHLAAQRPGLAITVLDRDAIGSGATRRSAGLHLLRGVSPRVRRMAAYSHTYYADLRRHRPELPIYPIDATVIRTGGGEELGEGYLDLARPVPARRPEIAELASDGVAGTGLRLSPGTRAWHISGCHHTDVYELAEALAASLRPQVVFLEGMAVTGLALSSGGVTVNTGTGESLSADRVVLAPGPWLTAPAWDELVAPLGLRLKKVAALHIARAPEPEDQAVIFDDEDAFLLPLAQRGHWLFSYTCPEWDPDPDDMTSGLSAAQLAQARACLRHYSPELAEECHGGRVFCGVYSSDREPVVAALDPDQRIVFAGGANGSGYRLGPAIAAEAAGLWPRSDSDEGATGDHQYV